MLVHTHIQTHPTYTGTQSTIIQVGRINDSESLRIASPLIYVVAGSVLVCMRMVEMRYNIEKTREGSNEVVSCVLVVKWDPKLP